MGNDEMLEKAIDTSDLADGGLLNTQQANKYIQMTIDSSVML